MKVFSGSSHPAFAQQICRYLGMDLGDSEVVSFSNENLMVQIQENVRECDVFVVQTSCPPVHQNLFELLIMIDAMRSASAARITAVVPYFPYIRSDKKDKPRISITARLIADLLKESGADRVLTMDLHAPQSQGFFRMPADQLQGAGPLCEILRDKREDDWILVAADAGEAKDLGRYANRLELPMAIIDKRRRDKDNSPVAENLIGDVDGKTAVIVDDEIASGGTLCEAAAFLRKHGAKKAFAVATHPVFSDNTVERMEDAFLEKVFVADTVPIPEEQKSPIVEQVSVANLFAEAISRIHDGRSVSQLFEPTLLREVLSKET